MSNISIIAYIILTLSIGYAFINPSFQDLNQLLSQKQEYADSLATIDNIQSKTSELQAQFNQISEADKKNIDTILPSSLDFVKLISQIDALAAKYGISIKNITSKTVDSSVGTSIDNAEPPKPYNSAIINFSFISSYENFKAFMGDLEKSLRILDIRSVQLEAQTNNLYSFDVGFETYWLK